MKTCVLGIDCLEPSLVKRWIEQLPAFRALCGTGVYGQMQSCLPPITVPAWSCMTSGCDPGVLGIYGFRNRRDYGYGKLAIADSTWVREPRIWDVLGKEGKKCVVIGVPGTYPAREVNGIQVSCFMTPGQDSDWAYPAEVKERVRAMLGGEDYPFDVENYRGDDHKRIKDDIFAGAEKRFAVARQLLAEERPDFFMMVDIGCDRIHHSMWQYLDQEHPDYKFDAELSTAIFDYYRFLDGQLEQFLKLIDLRETRLLIVSDHGATRCDGGFCINEWLRREGLLVLKDGAKAADEENIAWEQTTAWAEGGYYARIFLNVAGREPEGIVDPMRYEHARSEIAHRLGELRYPDGSRVQVNSMKPQQIYREVAGIAPDLIVFFGDLHLRALAGLNGESLFARGGGWGLDGANHGLQGFYCLCEPGVKPEARERNVTILDILPMLLGQAPKPAPDMTATTERADIPVTTPAVAPAGAPSASKTQQESVEKRLRDLGYLG